MPITVTIRADEVEDYYIHDDQTYTVTVSPSEPVFYYYNFPQDEQYSRAFIQVTSEDEVCLMVSVQDSLVSLFFLVLHTICDLVYFYDFSAQ